MGNGGGPAPLGGFRRHAVIPHRRVVAPENPYLSGSDWGLMAWLLGAPMETASRCQSPAVRTHTPQALGPVGGS